MRRPIDIGNGVSHGQPFGSKQVDYTKFGMVGHHGFDYPAPVGRPIFAPENGVVIMSANGVRDQYTGAGIAGETIVIRGARYEHWLMHLSVRGVFAGQHVTEGQHIGYSGNTGYTDGPHLHWGTRPLQPNIQNGYRGFIDPTIALHTPAPAPPPPPPAPAPPVVVRPYKIVDIAPKQVRFKINANRWGMNYDNITAISANPEGVAVAGQIITVRAVAHHNIGYQYYLEDRNVPSGYNTNDVEDVVAPPPPPPPAPKPPAPPLKGIPVEEYELVVPVPFYEDDVENGNIGYLDALHGQNKKGMLSKGVYKVWGKREHNMINLTTDNMKPGKWINPADNVIKPKPEIIKPVPEEPKAPLDIPVTAPEPVTNPTGWKVTRSLRPDGKPVMFRALNNQPVKIHDYEHKQDAITMNPFNEHQPVPIVSKFWKTNSFGDLIEYGRTQRVAKNGWYYGVPMDILVEITEDEDDEPPQHDESHLNNGKVEWRDLTHKFDKFTDDFIDYSGKFKGHALTAFDHAQVITEKTTKFIDGFRAGTKKKKERVK